MFGNLVGNNHVKEILERLIRSQRLPNSLLFAGEEGIGKKQFAIQIAKTFFCQNPQNFSACNQCPACRRATVFSLPKPDKKEEFEKVFFSEHPDLGMVVSFNRNILVKAIRQLEKEANFRPFEAEMRFFLIDNAEKMNEEAANALLKTLEEPVSTTFIILITSQPTILLPTIRSRCQKIFFSPLETSEIENYLLSEKQFSSADAKFSAGIAHGSIGRAINLDLEKFRQQRDKVFKTLEALSQHNRAVPFSLAEEIGDAKMKDEYEEYLLILQNLIHDLWYLKLEADEKMIVNFDILPQLKKISAVANRQNLANAINEIEVLRENLVINLNRKIATDSLFLKIKV